jgi:hypothetical protein
MAFMVRNNKLLPMSASSSSLLYPRALPDWKSIKWPFWAPGDSNRSVCSDAAEKIEITLLDNASARRDRDVTALGVTDSFRLWQNAASPSLL